jgi:hypothetical protein
MRWPLGGTLVSKKSPATVEKTLNLHWLRSHNWKKFLTASIGDLFFEKPPPKITPKRKWAGAAFLCLSLAEIPSMK